MMRKLEPKFVRHLFLQDLDLFGYEFNDLTALGTDHVIMMLVIKVMFVVSLVISEADLSGQPGLGQKF
jgi:hypothetical protein